MEFQAASKAPSDLPAAGGLVIAMAGPLTLYLMLDSAVASLAPLCTCVLVSLLSFTAIMLWIKMILVIGRTMRDPRSGKSVTRNAEYPPASAIVVGLFPIDYPAFQKTAEAFLSVNYPAHLQVVLAYSSEPSRSSQVPPAFEEELAEIVSKNPQRFSLCRVEGAGNQEEVLNAAMGLATGKFVAVFRAGHFPTKQCMAETYRWTERNALKTERFDSCGRVWDVSELAEMGGLSSMEAARERSVISTFWQTVTGGEEDDGAAQWLELTAAAEGEGKRSWRRKAEICYLLLWRKVFPAALLQVIPLLAFLLVKESGMGRLENLSTSRLATSLVLSSY